jgi:hypothetical protein
LFAPAALVEYFVIDRALWVQIAVVGPLCVLPIFVTSRVFGTWVDCNRDKLQGFLQPSPGPARSAAPVATAHAAPAKAPHAKTAPAKALSAQAAPAKAAPAGAPAKAAAAAPAPRFPRRPDSLGQFTAPVARPLTYPIAPLQQAPALGLTTALRRPTPAERAPAAPAKAATLQPTASARPSNRQDAPATKAPAQAPAAPATPRKPAVRPDAKPAPSPGQPAEPAPRPNVRPAPRAIEGRPPVHATDLPDLTHMPGAVVLSGRDRERHGAAAKKR